MKRNYKIDVYLNRSEVDSIESLAKKSKMNPSRYVRKMLSEQQRVGNTKLMLATALEEIKTIITKLEKEII